MKFSSVIFSTIILAITISYPNNEESDVEPDPAIIQNPNPITYADIDFSNWKLTLPVNENNNGNPDEYQPSELINVGYRTNVAIQHYLYNDSEDTENSCRDYHRTISMKIYGIISKEDMATHGFSSNNRPPLIKIHWQDGHIWCFKKSLIDEATYGDDFLETSSNTWVDLKVNLGYVGFEEFELRILALDARSDMQLSDDAPYIYKDVSLDKWPFKNYFKADNYLESTATGTFTKVKYYELEVTY